MNNYFFLNRSIFENKLWTAEAFTKAQAWIDLVGNANYKSNSFFIRGNEVKLERGQLGWSEITMAKRWKWSRNKVRNFLKWLKSEQQIEQQKLVKLTTIITIINYNKYQNDTTDDTTEGQQTIQQKVHNIHKVNKVNKVNKRYSDKWTLEEVGVMVVEAFNTHLGTKFKDSKSFLRSLERWLESYTPQEIEQAIKQIKFDKFWNGKMTPVLLFRQKNPQGEPVDYIGALLNNKEKYDDRR